MGYDMYIKNYEYTEAEQLAKKAADEQWDAALAVREKRTKQLAIDGITDWKVIHADTEWKAAQAEVVAASEAMSMTQLDYYRLNIWGMGRCREYMNERGMLVDNYSRDAMPAWPDYSEPDQREGESNEDWYKRIDEYDNEYSERCRPTRSWSPFPEAEYEGIPAHKFSSNDSWLVTEHECRTAAKLGREAPFPTYIDKEDGNKEKPVVWWESWLKFLESASTRGGFEVH
ncbi:hypothetical protein FDH86_gp084 [Arthrobacter phage Tank]|uniref:Uncharacterized protein n=1 Tax=Arthrobacter phage Tank TaxID=1772319 RepID=A0A0U4JV76_9CAUD|nr:hypothetical protein FDH86_gp084 [Arthrobacter phage Tank]ALY10619.1 hypothetical protein TANK_84 [Arthrobacter phage Tank]